MESYRHVVTASLLLPKKKFSACMSGRKKILLRCLPPFGLRDGRIFLGPNWSVKGQTGVRAGKPF